MLATISYYTHLTLLKSKPQDGPTSATLQKILLLVFLLSATAKSLVFYDMTRSMANSLIDLIFLIIFIRVMLSAKPERIHQTLNAMLGAGVILNSVIGVATQNLMQGPDTKTLTEFASIAFFIIFSWVVLVHAHIIRHATESSLSVGALISLGYSFVSTIVMVTVIGLLGI